MKCKKNSRIDRVLKILRFSFCTIDPNVGGVPLKDPRLYVIAKIFKPEKTLHTSIEFVDIAGLVWGASQGEGLGNQFLGHIKSPAEAGKAEEPPSSSRARDHSAEG